MGVELCYSQKSTFCKRFDARRQKMMVSLWAIDACSRDTGIKHSDWWGKIWARWSDALQEAGFRSNALQGAYNETALLEARIALARELGRLPARADLRMKRRSDTDFPSDHTLDKFGGKRGLIRRTLEYCRGRPGYGDIVALCELDNSTAKPARKRRIGHARRIRIHLPIHLPNEVRPVLQDRQK